MFMQKTAVVSSNKFVREQPKSGYLMISSSFHFAATHLANEGIVRGMHTDGAEVAFPNLYGRKSSATAPEIVLYN